MRAEHARYWRLLIIGIKIIIPCNDNGSKLIFGICDDAADLLTSSRLREPGMNCIILTDVLRSENHQKQSLPSMEIAFTRLQ